MSFDIYLLFALRILVREYPNGVTLGEMREELALYWPESTHSFSQFDINEMIDEFFEV